MAEEKKPINTERIDMKTKNIRTIPILLTNLTPKRLITTIMPSIINEKNLMLNARGPKLKPVQTWIASIAPNIDIADENVVAK